MNLKDWMKLEEDEKTVTLIHPKGHKMTIYSYALPKIQREQLKRLKFAKGGQIKPKVESNDHLAPASGGGVSEQGKDVREAKGAHYQSELTGVEADAKAGRHETLARHEARGRREMEKTVKPKMKGLAKGGVAHYDDGTQDQPVSQDDAQTQAAPPSQQDAVPDVPTAQPPAPNYAQAGPGNQAAATLQGIQQENAGLQNQRDVEIAQAKGMLPIQQERTSSANAIQQFNGASSRMMAEAANNLKSYNDQNPLNEDAYRENMSSERKVSTAIGLALGGMGSAFGGHNYAFDFLNKQIDRNIDAQKQRLENQKTVFGAYNTLFHDNEISTKMATASMAEIYDSKAKNLALQLGTPQAWARYQQLSGALAVKYQENRNAASSLATQKMINGQPVMPGAQNGQQNAPMPTGTGTNATRGASGSWDGSGASQPPPQGNPDRILNPNALPAYNWAMNKYNTTQSEDSKKSIIDEYKNAQVTDESLKQLDELWPEVAKKATYSGYLADKINPAAIGGLAGMTVEGLGAAGAIPTGGASLVGAIPAALGAAGAGTTLAAGVKQGLTGLGGQQNIQYENASHSAKAIITSRLVAAGLTPTEAQQMAEAYVPTAFTSKETAADALDKVKQKIIAMTKTPTLDANHLTRRSTQKGKK